MPNIEIWLDDEHIDKLIVIQKEMVKKYRTTFPKYAEPLSKMTLSEFAGHLLKQKIFQMHPQPIKDNERGNTML